MIHKCVCGYETDRQDNFLRHLQRKRNWCRVDNEDEQIILFYYRMMEKKRSFAVWIRNIRRVNLQFISMVVDE